jgi:hypothetical protein
MSNTGANGTNFQIMISGPTLGMYQLAGLLQENVSANRDTVNLAYIPSGTFAGGTLYYTLRYNAAGPVGMAFANTSPLKLVDANCVAKFYMYVSAGTGTLGSINANFQWIEGFKEE